jgi:hypothetical protein
MGTDLDRQSLMITLAQFRQLSLPRRAYATRNHATCMDGGQRQYFLDGFYELLLLSILRKFTASNTPSGW